VSCAVALDAAATHASWLPFHARAGLLPVMGFNLLTAGSELAGLEKAVLFGWYFVDFKQVIAVRA
jgi:hypothetical protein